MNTKLVSRVIPLINDAEQLATFTETCQEKCLMMVMFSTTNCPPCNYTKRMLGIVGQDGTTNMEFVANQFARRNGISTCLYICKLDDLTAQMNAFTPTPEFLNSALLNDVLKAREKVRQVPTFWAFYYLKGRSTNLGQIHVGGISSPDQLLSIMEETYLSNQSLINAAE